jgi:hypothetical protein
MIKPFSNFVKFCSDKVCFGLILNVIFLIIFAIPFFNIARNKALSVLIDQTYNKEELAVSSGTKSIHVFLEMAENSLLLLSRNPSVINQDSGIQKNLNDFALDWANTPLVSVARSDKDGKLIFMGNNVNLSSEAINNFYINNRNYFDWAKTAKTGDVFLGKPQLARIKTSNFSFLIPMATPIYQGSKFDGVLVLAISLSKFTTDYLESLEVSPDYRVYLVHPDGTILATPSEQTGLVKLNYFEYLQDNPYPGSEEAAEAFAKAAASIDKGRLDVILYSTKKNRPDRFLIAYSPLFLNDNQWTLGVAVPFDDIQANFVPLKETSVFLLSIVVLFTLGLSIMSILFIRTSQRRFMRKIGKTGN